MKQNIVHIEATNLPDLWYQTLYKAIELGRDFKIDQGSFAGQVRKEFDFVVLHSKCPGVGELLPKLNPALNLDDPVAQNYMDSYLPYLMTGEEQPGEAYTYGQRILAASIHKYQHMLSNRLIVDDIYELINADGDSHLFNQMQCMIWTYKNKGYRNNQMILQVGEPTDMMLKDPPCLRHIDTRIQNNLEEELINIKNLYNNLTGKCLSKYISLKTAKRSVFTVLNESDAYSQSAIDTFLKKCEVPELHFYPYFRSWDLWGGLPANLGAIELMKQYCANEIGVENGEIIATSKGLHLYDYVWEIAEIVRGKTSEEFKQEIRQ